MTEISPAAQAVYEAAWAAYWLKDAEHPADAELIAAAALRAVADQGENIYDPREGKASVVRVEHLLAVANELEAK